jgi:hypothetical protein
MQINAKAKRHLKNYIHSHIKKITFTHPPPNKQRPSGNGALGNNAAKNNNADANQRQQETEPKRKTTTPMRINAEAKEHLKINIHSHYK